MSDLSPLRLGQLAVLLLDNRKRSYLGLVQQILELDRLPLRVLNGLPSSPSIVPNGAYSKLCLETHPACRAVQKNLRKML